MTGGGFVSAVMMDKKSGANDAPDNSRRLGQLGGGTWCVPMGVAW